MIFGTTNRNMPSRFLKEIPDELCNIGGISRIVTPVKTDYSYSPKPIRSAHTVGAKTECNFIAGQRVRHKTFGDGLVITVTPMGGDSMLEIAFDTVGTKKLMAGYAKLTVI